MTKSFFLIPILFVHSLLVALPFANRCDSDACCNQFAVEVAALYWKTHLNDGVYGYSALGVDTNLVTFDYKTNVPNHDWGWRIRAGYLFSPSYFVDAEYTSFNQTTRDTSTPDVTVFTSFAFTEVSATATLKTRYQRVRGRGGLTLWEGNRANIYAFGGVSWIHLFARDNLNVPTSNAGPQFFLQRSKFDGAGFEAGMGATFHLLRWAGINVEFNGIGALGRRTYAFDVSSIDPESPQSAHGDYPNIHICFPGLDIRAEAFVTFCLGRPFKFAVGYEHHHFFDALLFAPLITSDFDPFEIAQAQVANSIGFGGMYLSLGVAF